MPVRTPVLRGLDPAPFRFGALEAGPADAPSPAPFAPLFPDAAGLEAAFAPLFAAGPPAPAPAAPAPAPETTPDPAPAPRGYRDGVEDGRAERGPEVAALEAEVARLADAVARAEDAGREHRRTVADAVARLSGVWSDAVRALEADLAALAVDVAEGVLDAPLTEAQRAAAAAALAQAVDALAGGPPIGIAVHPVDYLHVHESGLADALAGAHPGLHWDSDATLGEGDWRAATADGAVHRVRSEMLDALRDRLGLGS